MCLYIWFKKKKQENIEKQNNWSSLLMMAQKKSKLYWLKLNDYILTRVKTLRQRWQLFILNSLKFSITV